ncbi:glyoxalase-like protein [Humitalea rosea]|uniref:Glyoxalase-like protein n=1 Tax=Humitalea rosea TaxID=990373 RepID=A0A2W7IL00_9PROT|nr:VOC family protein [Humitalea rosea]PZW45965.1 glyoxalase-like protein [Humitalea rosea]
MLASLIGLDHAVVAVRDLDAAAAVWAGAGFTLSPRGLHSPHMGSGNYTMMFGEDYIELLGVVTETPRNAPLRGFLAEREGLERVAFTTTDAAAGVAAAQAAGSAATGPVEFGRPVPLPDGGSTEARFSVFHWPPEAAVGGLRIFACQHHTREAVWLPSLQTHANGVTRILRVLVATADAAAADRLAGLIDSSVREEGAFRVVPTGPGRADIAFATAAAIAEKYDIPTPPPEGGAGLVLGTPTPRAPVTATGCTLIFSEDTTR